MSPLIVFQYFFLEVVESYLSRFPYHYYLVLHPSIKKKEKNSRRGEKRAMYLSVLRVYFSLTLSFPLFLVALRCSLRVLQGAKKHTDNFPSNEEFSFLFSWLSKISYNATWMRLFLKNANEFRVQLLLITQSLRFNFISLYWIKNK